MSGNRLGRQRAFPRKINSAEFYRPIAGLLDPVRLQRKRVAVIGLGSGGSRVAAELGRLGVHLLLVERPNELLEEHNIVRHLLGYGSLGKAKLQEMVNYIHNLNPSIQIKACALDVVQQQASLERTLARWHPNLIAVCTDNEPSKHAINQAALRLKIPQTGGAVYDGGIGGEVYRVRPGQACYGCLAAQLQLERQFPKTNTPQNYDHPARGAGSTTCALNLDIAQIALLQCRLTLELLLRERTLIALPPEANLCVFANRAVPGTFARPWHAQFFSVPRKSDCLDCAPAFRDVELEAEKIFAALQSPT